MSTKKDNVKQTIHLGTIKGNAKIPLGHQSHISGCGAHKNKKRDIKHLRAEAKRACKGE